MQRIFWRWKDDDLTSDMNSWLLGIIEPGLIRGFDPVLGATMNLTLTQATTGIIKTKTDVTLTDPIGIAYTPQGSVVTEDADVVLPIELGGSLPRIDTIYLEHSYTPVTGGTPATYAVIKGTESTTPVAPDLISPNIQIKLGELYVPAGTTALTGSGVVYTRSNNAVFGNHDYAVKNQVNIFTKQNLFAPEEAATYISFIQTLVVNDTSNIAALPNTLSTTNYIRYILATNAINGLELQLKVTSSDVLIKQGGGVNQITNLIEGTDAVYSLGTILYLRFNGTTWDLYDVSAKSILRDHNLYQNSSQHKFSTNGVKIKSVTYTVGVTTHTIWILEINPLADNFILDLTDSSLMGGFDPSINILACGMIDVLPGLKDSGNGFTAKIYIKSNANTALLAAHSTASVLNPALRSMANVAEMLNAKSGSIFGLDVLEIHKAHATYPTVSELEITLTPDNKFIFKPITRLNQLNGGTDYVTNAIGATSSDSHKKVLDLLLASVTEVDNNFTVLGGAITTTGEATVSGPVYFYTRVIGKVVHFSFQGPVTITNGGGGGSLIIPTPLNLKVLSGNIAVGSAITEDNTNRIIGLCYMRVHPTIANAVQMTIELGSTVSVESYYFAHLHGTLILN